MGGGDRAAWHLALMDHEMVATKERGNVAPDVGGSRMEAMEGLNVSFVSYQWSG